ncbi:origin recognition complex subunit 5-like [Hydractinia symbiolongicarpus]|uniref:origin recognition complex subunit 5-like n=1 Tax=Hydractinia symbiolongicarpus TaxID=13093 RepID=UPI002550FF1F|nr:origin recognition complex subunit 5-like [Hydractinia symbiolongicarpus]
MELHEEEVEASNTCGTQTDSPIVVSKPKVVLRSIGTQTSPISVRNIGYQVNMRPRHRSQCVQVTPDTTNIHCQTRLGDQGDWDKDDDVDDDENVDDDETDEDNYEFDDDCDDDNIVPQLNSTTIEKMRDLTPEFFANMLGLSSITSSNKSCIHNVDEDDETNEEELLDVSFNDSWLKKSEERCED